MKVKDKTTFLREENYNYVGYRYAPIDNTITFYVGFESKESAAEWCTGSYGAWSNFGPLNTKGFMEIKEARKLLAEQDD